MMCSLIDTENDTETGTDNDNYGLHCNMQNTSHCTETLALMPLATFSHFIGLGTCIVLGGAQCEHAISILPIERLENKLKHVQSFLTYLPNVLYPQLWCTMRKLDLYEHPCDQFN